MQLVLADKRKSLLICSKEKRLSGNRMSCYRVFPLIPKSNHPVSSEARVIKVDLLHFSHNKTCQNGVAKLRHTWNVFLGVQKVVIESSLFPVNCLFLVGLGV